MASQKVSKSVTPANAGVYKWLISLDSRVRGNDENGSVTFYETINTEERYGKYGLSYPRRF